MQTGRVAVSFCLLTVSSHLICRTQTADADAERYPRRYDRRRSTDDDRSDRRSRRFSRRRDGTRRGRARSGSRADKGELSLSRSFSLGPRPLVSSDTHLFSPVPYNSPCRLQEGAPQWIPLQLPPCLPQCWQEQRALRTALRPRGGGYHRPLLPDRWILRHARGRGFRLLRFRGGRGVNTTRWVLAEGHLKGDQVVTGLGDGRRAPGFILRV